MLRLFTSREAAGQVEVEVEKEKKGLMGFLSLLPLFSVFFGSFINIVSYKFFFQKLNLQKQNYKKILKFQNAF